MASNKNILWEETVPLLQQGHHKTLLEKAFQQSASNRVVLPFRENVFSAMRLTSLDATKVVIIGQDPYFNIHPTLGPEAHGLCFSVRNGIPAPPSLRNIFKEIGRSIYQDEQKKFDTDLTRWAVQGVLLLNASLTVIAKQPNSHAKLGWHELTDNVIQTISEKREHVVFMLWGAFAQKKAEFIDKKKHYILTTSHPSPLSAHRGFLGSDIFALCNNYLVDHEINPIAW